MVLAFRLDVIFEPKIITEYDEARRVRLAATPITDLFLALRVGASWRHVNQLDRLRSSRTGVILQVTVLYVPEYLQITPAGVSPMKPLFAATTDSSPITLEMQWQ